MPTLIKPLDEGKAYMFCPQCRTNGNSVSPVMRDGHIFRCQFGHEIYGAQLNSGNADMVKSADVFLEQPTITDIKWPVWINPKVKDRIEAKFRGRVMITVATLLAALSEDSLVMITGEQAHKLREKGIKSGADMLAYIEGLQEMEKDHEKMIKQIEQFQNLLKAAGVA